jgi:hypothetical protein
MRGDGDTRDFDGPLFEVLLRKLCRCLIVRCPPDSHLIAQNLIRIWAGGCHPHRFKR